ncbi:MAG: lysostaphin resistance A-like protein [Planctomycetota bacterium]
MFSALLAEAATAAATAPAEISPFEKKVLGFHAVMFVVGIVLFLRDRRLAEHRAAPPGLPEAAKWGGRDVGLLLGVFILLVLGAGTVVNSLGIEAGSSASIGLSSLIYVGATAFCFYLVRLARNSTRALGFAQGAAGLGRSIRTGLIVFLMSYPAVYGLKILSAIGFAAFGVEPEINTAAVLIVSSTSWAQIAFVVAIAVLSAPLLEEILFRGFLYGYARQRIGIAQAIVATAAFFALVHPPVDWAPIFALGVALCVAYERAGSIAAPMTVHFVNNMLGVSMLLMQRWVEGGGGA